MLPVLVSAAPILTATGMLAGAVMVLQDISALKELERRREEWASIVTHDLRQPIGVIALRSSLLLRTSLSDDQRDAVRQINASAQRLARMASDLMDASLLESHRLHVNTDRLTSAGSCTTSSSGFVFTPRVTIRHCRTACSSVASAPARAGRDESLVERGKHSARHGNRRGIERR
jgi:light-regulated signal transduction histidine kinase (bacteriophytochrome)